MVDTTLNNFLSSGTHAERLAFTPSPGAERPSGNDPSYFWVETDTNNAFAWNFDGAAWIQVSTGGSATVSSVGLSLPSTLFNVTGSPVTSTGTLTGTMAAPIMKPGGRLTLTSGTPVMTANATAQTTVYYDSYEHGFVPVFDGTSVWTMLPIGSDEISMGLDAVTPHVASGSVYDTFGINNSGTLVIAVGPAWSSTTTRGTGAGTTQLSRQNGVWVNTNALTHAWGGASGTTDYGSVGAKAATYLGSLYATANGQTGMNFNPAATAGGNNNFLALYNAYNRVRTVAQSRDSTASWTYATNTWRATDAGATGSGLNNRVTFLDGLQQSSIQVLVTLISGSTGYVGANLDATTGAPTLVAGNETSSQAQVTIQDSFLPQLGLHFAQGMENSNGSSVTFRGSTVTGAVQAQAIIVTLDM